MKLLHLPTILTLAASFSTTALALPASVPHILHEQRPSHLVPQLNIATRTRVHPSAIIPLRIGLKQSNLDAGYTELLSISDPSSSRYGRHWTAEQVFRTYAPSSISIQSVRSWLVTFTGKSEHEIVQSFNQGWVAVNLPAWQAEALMRTEYYEYFDPEEGTTRLGCEQYYLPSHVSEYVDLIKPGVSLSPPLRKQAVRTRATAVEGWPKLMPKSAAANDTAKFSNSTILGNSTMALKLTSDLRNCGSSITPACLRAMYNIPVHSSSSSNNNLGVFETGGAYDQADLDQYFANFAKNVPQGTHPAVASVNGGQAPVDVSEGQGESVIDLDIMHSLAYPEAVTLYQVDSFAIRATQAQFEAEVTFLTPFLDAIDGAFCTSLDVSSGLDCGVYNLTKVISASYVALELAYGERAQHRTCHEIMKLGLMGHTVIFASGDFGVAGFPKPSSNYNGCVNSALQPNGPSSGSIFNPSFPSNCPYILSVGATKLNANDTVADPESVMAFPASSPGGSYFGSGGGFSNYFPRPAYQLAAVQHYLDYHAPPYPSYTYNGNDRFSGSSNIGANNGVFNIVGRAYPDVSANGASMTAFVRGKRSNWLGTSLAAPIWASVIAKLNTERARVGKGSVGFVQPVLYQHPEVFHDVVTGSNLGCDGEGFGAAEGWDPASGLGTPRYGALNQLFLSLP